MADLINAADSLNAGRGKINAIIKAADAAVTTADNAATTANEAKTTANSVQTQLDTIILDSGTSDAEIVQSRVDKDGNPYQTLKSRLDSEKSIIDQSLVSLGSQLADIDSQVDLLNRGLGETFATLSDLQTAYPTGDTKDHIVGADGHRYYWNDTAWADGGAYQAVEVIDGSVTPEKIKFVTTTNDNLLNPHLVTKQNIASNGTISSSSNYVLSDFIPIMATEILYITRQTQLALAKNAILTIAVYDASKNFISLAPNATYFSQETVYLLNEKITVSKNGFIRLVITVGKESDLCISNECSFKPYVYKFDSTYIPENKVENLIKPVKNLIDESKTTDGYVDQSGNFTASTSYKATDFIPIEKNVDYVISPSVRKLVLFNEYKQPIYTAPFVNADTANYVLNSAVASYVRISYRTQYIGSIQMEYGATPTVYEAYKVGIANFNVSMNLAHYDLNPLWGKSLLNFGDSIAAGDGAAGVGWAERIGQKYGMIYNDYAVGGATVSVIEGSTNNILKRINDAITNSMPADYITFNGLTNDASTAGIVVGAITSGYSDALDTSTFCGAFEQMCKTMRLNWLDAKIVYVRPHNMDSRGSQQITYGDLALQICKKWAIPVVDLYSAGGLNTQLQEFKNVYTDAGGTHPNSLGYDTFYVPQIEAKLKVL